MWKWAPVLGLVACSSGGGDLNTLTEKPKPLGNPIAEQSAPGPKRLQDNQTIVARGVVIVAIDNYDDSGQGAVGDIYVQDAVQTGPKGTPWSGLRLFRPTKNPPDLELAPGQGVDLVGNFVAFAGPPPSVFANGVVVPQASNAALTLTSEGRPPEPIEITVDDVRDRATQMINPDHIQFASRLVRIRNVVLTSDFGGARPEASTFDEPPSSTRTSQLSLSAKLYPVHKDPTLNLKKGMTIKSVTGVLDYFFNFKLCPRSRADIEL
jgi:hypothetical protein